MKNIFFSLFLLCSTAAAQYSLSVQNIGGAVTAKDKNSVRVTLQHNGAEVRTIERTLPFDVPFPSTSIDEASGTFVLIYAFDGFAEVYGADGGKRWEKNFFKGMSPNYERTITAAIGATGIVFLTSDVRQDRALVHRYALSGRKEWERALPYALGYEIAMSPDERTVAAGSYSVNEGTVRRAATVMNKIGSVEGESSILFRHAAFQTDGAMLALSSEKEIVLYDVMQKKEIERTERSGSGIITDIRWDGSTLHTIEAAVITSPTGPVTLQSPVLHTYDMTLRHTSARPLSDGAYRHIIFRTTAQGPAVSLDDRMIPVREQ